MAIAAISGDRLNTSVTKEATGRSIGARRCGQAETSILMDDLSSALGAVTLLYGRR